MGWLCHLGHLPDEIRPAHHPVQHFYERIQPITSLPVLILILLLVFAYAVVIPLLVFGLFLGFRYRFSGPDLEKESINSVMGSVADTAADVGRQVMDEISRRSGRSDREGKE